MKSLDIAQRTQLIKGVIYVYEDYPYWDPVKKQTRHKRVYIGKKDDNGTFIPNKRYLARTAQASASETALEPVVAGSVKRTYGGFTYLLDDIASQTSIAQDLKVCFPQDYKAIISLAYYLVCESDAPMYRYAHWAGRHAVAEQGLSSQRISEIFSRISYEGAMSFLNKQKRRYQETEYLVYDITSISSYSELIRQVRYGNNKQGEDLPQINLALVFGQESLMPLYYRRLPGNISDVTTLKKLLRDLNHLEFDKVKMVLDRGFHSARNIDDLYKNRYKFILGARKNSTFIQQHIQASREKLQTFTTYDSELGLHCHTVTDQWPYQEYNKEERVTGHGERRIYVHVYFDPVKAEADKAALYRQLTDLSQLIGNQELTDTQKALAEKYLILPPKSNKNKKVAYNEQAIEQKRASFGYFVLLSNEIKSANEALHIYRNKDVVEKSFSNLKNRLNLRRLNVSSEESLEGKIFVQFVALMFVSWIHKVMKKQNLYKNWTMQELFDELDTIERFEQKGKRAHYSEVTSKQRGIYTSFNLAPPNML